MTTATDDDFTPATLGIPTTGDPAMAPVATPDAVARANAADAGAPAAAAPPAAPQDGNDGSAARRRRERRTYDVWHNLSLEELQRAGHERAWVPVAHTVRTPTRDAALVQAVGEQGGTFATIFTGEFQEHERVDPRVEAIVAHLKRIGSFDDAREREIRAAILTGIADAGPDAADDSAAAGDSGSAR